MDAADEVADLLERRLRLLVGVSKHPLALLRIVVDLLLRRAETGGQGDEALLGAVVEVALDPSPLGLGAVDGGGPARLQPLHLGGVDGVGARAEQGAGDRDTHPSHADRHPRCDQGEAGQSDETRTEGTELPG